MDKNIFTNKKLIVVFGILCCFLWGSATPAIKIGYKLFRIPSSETMSIALFAGIRFTFAGILTFIIGSLISRKALIPKKNNWGIASLQALIQTVLQYFFFFVGVANTVAAKGPVISGACSFFSVLIAGYIFKMEKVTPRKILGCVIGFIGILILNIGNGFEFSFKLIGEGAIVFSIIMYSLSSSTIKLFSSREDPVTLCAWQFFLGGLALTAMGLIGGGRLNPSSPKAYFVLAYLSLLSAVAYMLWSMLLKYNDVSTITVYSLATPVFGVALSLLLLDEKINLMQYLIALVLVCFGIYLVNMTRKNPKSAGENDAREAER